MSFFNTQNPTLNSCTSIIHRPAGGIAGVREVFDDASRLAVWSFPMAHARDLLVGKSSVTACYILAGHDTVYLGETNNLYRRLSEHVLDSDQSVCSRGIRRHRDRGCSFRQDHRRISAVGARSRSGKRPDWSRCSRASIRACWIWPRRRATLDRIVEDALRLLFDAGCCVFHSNCASMRPVTPNAELPEQQSPDIAGDAAEADDTGPMEIGVAATPTGAPEFELSYGDLWARGYPSNDGFVVTAGARFALPSTPASIPSSRTVARTSLRPGCLLRFPA